MESRPLSQGYLNATILEHVGKSVKGGGDYHVGQAAEFGPGFSLGTSIDKAGVFNAEHERRPTPFAVLDCARVFDTLTLIQAIRRPLR